MILADRGSDIQDFVACYYAEVKIPDFTKGRKQLAPMEVENTKGIASVRIHVKQVKFCWENRDSRRVCAVLVGICSMSEGMWY